MAATARTGDSGAQRGSGSPQTPPRHHTCLRELREATGKSQQQVADELGVSKATYSSWETGARELKASRIIELARCLGVTPNDILGYHGAVSFSYHLTPVASEFVELTERVPKRHLESALDLLQAASKGRRPRS